MHVSRLLFRYQLRYAAFICAAIICFTAIFARGQTSLVDSTFEVGTGADGAVYALVLQNDGRIVVGGSFGTISGQSCSNLARLLPNGHFDASFTNGATDGQVLDLAAQPDGNIIVSGYFSNLQGTPCQGLGRILTNGMIDTNFNTGAFFVTNGTPYKLAIQPDGKILVGTLSQRLFRLETNGALDDTFVQTNIFEDYWVHGLLVQTNGNIFVGGGFSAVNGFASPGLVLLDSRGELNTNFQSGLQAISDVFSIVPHTNGGFLVGGIMKQTNGSPDTVLQRLTASLRWDNNFVPGPFTPESPPYGIRSILLQPNGKIVAGGTFYYVGGYWRRGIVRLNADGTVDPCFDPGVGLGGFDGANIVVPQPDGRVLVGGDFQSTGYIPANIARLLPQSDCNATRVYLQQSDSSFDVAGTCPPGGTNFLQSSTNLIDWTDLDVETNAYVFSIVDSTASTTMFFRVKRMP